MGEGCLLILEKLAAFSARRSGRHGVAVEATELLRWSSGFTASPKQLVPIPANASRTSTDTAQAAETTGIPTFERGLRMDKDGNRRKKRTSKISARALANVLPTDDPTVTTVSPAECVLPCVLERDLNDLWQPSRAGRAPAARVDYNEPSARAVFNAVGGLHALVAFPATRCARSGRQRLHHDPVQHLRAALDNLAQRGIRQPHQGACELEQCRRRNTRAPTQLSRAQRQNQVTR